MGEIADALKRAREEEAAQRSRSDSPPKARSVADVVREVAVDAAIDHAGIDQDWPEPQLSGVSFPRLDPKDVGIVSPPHEKMELSRHLAHRVAAAMERKQATTLAVVSALRTEGKSTVSANLAIAMASISQGRSVALVDLDLRKPTVAKKLGLTVDIGVEQVIEGKEPLERACISVENPSLDIYPTGTARNEAHELLVQSRFSEMIEELRRRYSVIILDTPPVLLVPDSVLILRHVEACVAVARMGVTKARSVSNMLESLPRQKLLGTILNASKTPWHARNYDSYYYGSDPEGSVPGETP